MASGLQESMHDRTTCGRRSDILCSSRRNTINPNSCERHTHRIWAGTGLVSENRRPSCSPPSLPYVSSRLAGIAWTRKEKWASLSLFVFPFAKDLARLSSHSERLRGLVKLYLGTRFDYYCVELLFGPLASTICGYLWYRERAFA
jgi:hypothetical protein